MFFNELRDFFSVFTLQKNIFQYNRFFIINNKVKNMHYLSLLNFSVNVWMLYQFQFLNIPDNLKILEHSHEFTNK